MSITDYYSHILIGWIWQFLGPFCCLSELTCSCNLNWTSFVVCSSSREWYFWRRKLCRCSSCRSCWFASEAASGCRSRGPLCCSCRAWYRLQFHSSSHQCLQHLQYFPRVRFPHHLHTVIGKAPIKTEFNVDIYKILSQCLILYVYFYAYSWIFMAFNKHKISGFY